MELRKASMEGLASDDFAQLHEVFHPRSVAVVGASSKFGKWGQMILTNIIGGGFKGGIYPVNPREKSICGLRVYKSLTDVEEPVDLVFITVPAKAVAEVLDQGGKKGVKGAVVISSGFSETDNAGKELEEKIVSICRQYGIKLIGPNTMGIISPYAGLFSTGVHSRPGPGSVAFISQSGNMGNQLIHWARQQGIGISLFVGSGNEAMLKCPDYLEYLANDPHTQTIMLYLENVGNGRRFLEVAARVNRQKPIILLKGGRTEAGISAAASHTGAMGGEFLIFEAACRQAGIISVDAPGELLNLSAGFSSIPLPRGNRVGIVTLGGGWGVVTSDKCNENGLVVPSIPENAIESIGRYLPPFWSKGNPVDLVGTRDLEVPVVAVEELLKYEGIDAVITMGFVGRHELVALLIQTTREVDPQAAAWFLDQVESASSGYEEKYVAKMVELMEKYEKPVIGVSLTRSEKGTVRPVAGGKYSGLFYETPEDAVNVLAKMVKYNDYKLRNLASL